MKKLLFIAAALLAGAFTLRADTSYLLIQGGFGAGGAEQTYLWKVLYQPGSLTNSEDLLTAVFGQPVDTGTTFTETFGTYEVYSAGNSQQKVEYLRFSFGDFVLSYTLNGVTQRMDPSGSPGWSAYVAGGSGEFANPDFTPGNYASGSWTYANDGIGTRGLSNGSFDGWVFQDTNTTPGIDHGTTTNAPTAANFASATVVTVQAVPEPGSAALLLVGLVGLVWHRRR